VLVSLLPPYPVDAIGEQKLKLRIIYYLCVSVIFLIVIISVFSFAYHTFPLIYTIQRRIDYENELPYFRICINPAIFGAQFSIIGFRVFNYGDCVRGDLHNIMELKSDKKLCDFIEYDNRIRIDCFYVKTNSSLWFIQDSTRTLRLLIVLHTHKTNATMTTPLSRLLFFTWIPPPNYEEVKATRSWLDLPQCNQQLLGINGITLLDFSIDVFEESGVTCYTTASNFIPYTRHDRQRVCQYVNQSFIVWGERLNCSAIADEVDNEKYFFIQLQMTLSRIYTQYYHEEKASNLVLRILTAIGGVGSLVPPLLLIIFSWIFTRWIFWKKRDAYYSDEVREAITYFLQKERESRRGGVRQT
jgi:hypothetical protein